MALIVHHKHGKHESYFVLPEEDLHALQNLWSGFVHVDGEDVIFNKNTVTVLGLAPPVTTSEMMARHEAGDLFVETQAAVGDKRVDVMNRCPYLPFATLNIGRRIVRCLRWVDFTGHKRVTFMCQLSSTDSSEPDVFSGEAVALPESVTAREVYRDLIRVLEMQAQNMRMSTGVSADQLTVRVQVDPITWGLLLEPYPASFQQWMSTAEMLLHAVPRLVGIESVRMDAAKRSVCVVPSGLLRVL